MKLFDFNPDYKFRCYNNIFQLILIKYRLKRVRYDLNFPINIQIFYLLTGKTLLKLRF